MARHLYIGNDVAVARTAAGILDDKAVEIQKLSASGPTAMVPGDTIASSPQFRIVQGNGTRDIVSPWIYGKDVINWGGRSAAAQTAEVAVATISTNALAAGTHTLKVINLTNGASPSEMKSYDIAVAASANPTTQGAALLVAIDADVPHWVKTTAHSSGAVSLTGYKKGEVKADGSVQEELVHMTFTFEALSTASAANDSTMAVTYSTVGSRGTGDGYYVKQTEENLRGAQYGYYNRLELPNTPGLTAVVGTAYDMYTIAATKDGSSASQINGVDNLIEINIAMDPSTAAITNLFESQLNGYLASANFGSVNL
tara:strand:- start:963 stop:1901 length:939 start_codon:yes stop_codon:yes gene_type:complete